MCQRLHELLAVYAHQFRIRPRGIGERPQNVKYGPETDPFSHRSHKTHCRMVLGRIHKTDIALFENLRIFFRFQIQLYAKCLQTVRCAAFARHASVSVLCHLVSCRRRDNACHRTDIDGVCLVPACSHDLEHIPLHGHLCAMLAHPFRKCGDLLDRLTLHAKRREKRCHIDLLCLPAHDLIHHLLRLVRCQIDLFHDLFCCLHDHFYHSYSLKYTQKVFNHLFAMRRHDRLRVKLQAICRILPVLYCHHNPSFVDCRDLQHIRDPVRVRRKRMIPCNSERSRKSSKDPAVLPDPYHALLAMHQFRRICDPAPKSFADRLVSKAYPQQRYLSARFPDQRLTYTCVRRLPRPR